MSKLRIGILGASRGMDYANRVLLNYEFAEITAICESYDSLCMKTDEYFKSVGKTVECYNSFDDLLNSGIDAVIICNCANEHASYAIRALEHGIHVMSEVLPVQTLAEAVQLCEAVEKSGCIYAYAENYCYFDATFAMRRHYEAGDIGEAVYMEGDFINDCSSKWHLLTRGVRDHWRNYVPSSFYCTHSIGPMLFSTGLRAVEVNGREIPRMKYMADVGARSGSAAMEMMELSNGGIAKSMNGNYRNSFHANYRIIGEEGTLECSCGLLKITHYNGSSYISNEFNEKYYPFKYRAEKDIGAIQNADMSSLGFFIGSILGDSECKKYLIDVYKALDMSLPGLFAFRSIINHGTTFEIPDMRDHTAREKFRNDFYSTDPRTPDEYLLPTSKNGTPDVPDSVYDEVKKRFLNTNLTPGGK